MIIWLSCRTLIIWAWKCLLYIAETVQLANPGNIEKGGEKHIGAHPYWQSVVHTVIPIVLLIPTFFRKYFFEALFLWLFIPKLRRSYPFRMEALTEHFFFI